MQGDDQTERQAEKMGNGQAERQAEKRTIVAGSQKYMQHDVHMVCFRKFKIFFHEILDSRAGHSPAKCVTHTIWLNMTRCKPNPHC